MTPEKPQTPTIFQADDADIDVALLEDAVLDEKLLQIVETLRNGSHQAPMSSISSGGNPDARRRAGNKPHACVSRTRARRRP